MRRCRISVAAISGSVTTIVAAMIWPHGTWNALPPYAVNEVMAMGTVYLPGDWMNETA
jgi:hypothetical protein